MRRARPEGLAGAGGGRGGSGGGGGGGGGGWRRDRRGPRIRVGTFPGGAVELTQGSRVRLVSGEGGGDAGRVFVQHPDTIRFRPGDLGLCSDGMVVLTVRDLDAKTVVVDVVTGATLADHKGVALPGVEVGLPAVTPKDEADLAFGRDVGVGLVAASFVTRGADIRLVRSDAGDVPVIAKIERAEAEANLGALLDEAEGGSG